MKSKFTPQYPDGECERSGARGDSFAIYGCSSWASHDATSDKKPHDGMRPGTHDILGARGSRKNSKDPLNLFFASRRMFVQFILLAVNTLTSPSLSPSFRLSRVHPKRRIHFYCYKQTSSFSLFTNLMRVSFSLSRGRGEGVVVSICGPTEICKGKHFDLGFRQALRG